MLLFTQYKTTCLTAVSTHCLVVLHLRKMSTFIDPGADTEGGIRAIAALKDTYESIFIHHNFVKFGKQHSRYMAILSSVVLSQQCCEVYFISLTVAKLL